MRLPFLRTGRISPHTGYSAPRVFLFYFTDFPLSRFFGRLPVDIYTLCKTHTPSLLLLDGVEKHIPPLFNILFTHCSPFFFGIFVLRHVPSLNRHRKPCRASLQLSHCGSLSTRGISGPMTRPSGRIQQLVGRVLDRPFPYGYFRIFTSRLTQKSGERLALLPIAPRFCFAYFVIVCALLPPDLFMQTAPRKYFRGAVTAAFVQTAYQTTLPVTI